MAIPTRRASHSSPASKATRRSLPGVSRTQRSSLPSAVVYPITPHHNAPHLVNAHASQNGTGPSSHIYDASWHAGIARLQMRVRDSELDQFGVVNNSVYSSYLQHARHEALACLGLSCDESARAGTPLALSDLSISFKAPLRSRDVFEVSAWVEKLTGARLTVGHCITLVTHAQPDNGHHAGPNTVAHQVIAEATATVVWLDSNYKPTRVPTQARKVLQEQLDARLAAQTAPTAVSSK